MEYLPCGSLRKFIQRSRELTEEEIKHIICEIIAAMEFVHKAGYILRDLKVNKTREIIIKLIINLIVRQHSP